MILEQPSSEYRIPAAPIEAALRKCWDELGDALLYAFRMSHQRGGSWLGVERAVNEFTASAHQHDIPPERLLVQLKRILDDILPGASAESPLRETVVTMAIEAYYA